MLRKAITTLVVLGEEEQRLRIQHDTATYVDSTQVRRRFEQESQLRREREVWHEWIRETLLPRAYLGFTSLVADTQFAQLGVVLVGVLADVMSVVGAPTASKEDAQATTLPSESKSQAKTLKATSLRVTGVHSGEIVERMYDSDDMGEVIERGDVREGSAIDGDDTRVTKPAGLHIHKPGARGSDDEDDHDDAADEMDQDVNANNTLTVASYEVKVASSSSFPPPETISTTTTRTTDHKSRPMKGAPAVTKGESTTLPSKSRLKTMTSSGNLSTTSSRNPSKAPPPKPASSKLKDKKREKKKTKTNAIDDLFAGLL